MADEKQTLDDDTQAAASLQQSQDDTQAVSLARGRPAKPHPDDPIGDDDTPVVARTYEDRNCLNCKQLFSPNREWQTFCSRKCRGEKYFTRRRNRISRLVAEEIQEFLDLHDAHISTDTIETFAKRIAGMVILEANK